MIDMDKLLFAGLFLLAIIVFVVLDYHLNPVEWFDAENKLKKFKLWWKKFIKRF